MMTDFTLVFSAIGYLFIVVGLVGAPTRSFFHLAGRLDLGLERRLRAYRLAD